MGWIEENLQIISTLGSALTVYTAIRWGARKEAKELKQEIKEIKNSIQILDSRISRIEGQLAPRIWEPQIIHKQEEKK